MQKTGTVVIDGEISNVYATGNHILQTDGGTAVIIGENGRILNNHAYYGAVYINGTDEHLDIYGKINGNICANRGGGVVLSNNGGNHNATMYEGAEICNNKAEQTGGGAMISKGVFTMNGGTISGNISGTNSAKGEADPDRRRRICPQRRPVHYEWRRNREQRHNGLWRRCLL